MLEGADPITCRPADILEPELEAQTAELTRIASEKDIRLADDVVDDVLTYALFPQIGLMFLENRDNPAAFEPAPWDEPEVPGSGPAAGLLRGPASTQCGSTASNLLLKWPKAGQLASVAPAAAPAAPKPAGGGGEPVNAVLAGNIFKVHVAAGATVEKGDPLLVVEAMKMETVVASPRAGTLPRYLWPRATPSRLAMRLWQSAETR